MSVTLADHPNRVLSSPGASVPKRHGAPLRAIDSRTAASIAASSSVLPTTSYNSTEPGADIASTRSNNVWTAVSSRYCRSPSASHTAGLAGSNVVERKAVVQSRVRSTPSAVQRQRGEASASRPDLAAITSGWSSS